jgi:hypothetical protein
MGMEAGGTTTYPEGETRLVAGHELTDLHIFPLTDIPEAPPRERSASPEPQPVRSTEKWPGVPPIPFPTHPPTAA